MGRVTIKDVAKEAGVSKATVSYVLSGSDLIAEKTAQKVRAAADKLGYSVNHAARMLATDRTSAIGIFAPPHKAGYFSLSFGGYLYSLSAAARAAGYDTMKETITRSDGAHRSPSGADNEPWSMGETVEKVLVKFINLRKALRPYTRELFEQAHEDGQPLVRGLFYEFPSDAAAADVADEYMFGSDLLVAPVMEYQARERAVYLPGDASVTWTDLRDGKTYAGGFTVTVAAPLDTVPVFARDGRDHGLAGRL